MNCHFTEKISLLIDGELNEDEAKETTEHLSTCDACQRAHSDFLRLRSHLNSYASAPDFIAQRRALRRILVTKNPPVWRRRIALPVPVFALSLKLPENLKAEAEKRSNVYGGEDLFAAETRREHERLARLNSYRAKLVDGPVLILPLSNGVNYSFNPNNLIPLDNLGTIYPNVRITDVWGIVDVKGGALMVYENGRPSKLYVTVPADTNVRSLQGEGWTLQLNDGWKLEPAERRGDYLLKKGESQPRMGRCISSP